LKISNLSAWLSWAAIVQLMIMKGYLSKFLVHVHERERRWLIRSNIVYIGCQSLRNLVLMFQLLFHWLIILYVSHTFIAFTKLSNHFYIFLACYVLHYSILLCICIKSDMFHNSLYEKFQFIWTHKIVFRCE
jgi:hypothetical protein